MKKITISTGLIEGKERLKLYFEYNKEVIALVKTIPGARWDPKEKCWHVATQAGGVERLNRRFEGKLVFEEDKGTGRNGDKGIRRQGDKETRRGGITIQPISPVRDDSMVEKTGGSTIKSHRDDSMVAARDDRKANDKSGERAISRSGEVSFDRNVRLNLVPVEFIKTMTLKNYSKNTIRTYKSMMQEFLEYHKQFDPEKITEEQIRDYLLYLLDERKISISYQNQSINAIKFYYEKILGRPVRTYYIQRPKKPRVLPNVLSEEEVQMILNNVDNLKHKCIISLAYSAGLRLNEVINMKPGDIDSPNNFINVRQGKGRKDRRSLLSVRVLILLRQYYKEYKPKVWLFEGQFGDQYSATSIHNILKAAVTKAGVKKRVTVHTLRHSFATHLLERGTDIRYIQELLGHQSSRTTEIYTHMTQKGLGKIKSPLDNLDF